MCRGDAWTSLGVLPVAPVHEELHVDAGLGEALREERDEDVVVHRQVRVSTIDC